MFDLITLEANKNGLDPYLVYAIVLTETNGNAYAVRYEPNFKWIVKPEMFAIPLSLSMETETLCQKMSWGYMQIMGAVARQYGFKSHIPELTSPQTGLAYGCQHLAALKKKYPEMSDYIAAYNAGSPRKYDGKYSNQSYVDKVLSRYASVKK